MTFTILLLAALAHLSAMQSKPVAARNPTVPTVTFNSVWDQATPQEYVFTTRADGSTSYLSRGSARPVQADEHRVDKRWGEEEKPAATETAEDKEPDFQTDIKLSSATAERIFKDAEQANFFNGSFDFTKHAIANTGRKTLAYADPGKHFETTFNFSENKAVDDLAHLFQAISNTVESGRKLEFKHKYDKLGLESVLKAMEDSMGYHGLAELQLIAPTLQSIADDSSVLNIARARARKLLAKAK